MDAAPPPPPLPASLFVPNVARKAHPQPPPQPQHAAIPFNLCSPVQATNHSPEPVYNAQSAENLPLFHVQNGPVSSPADEQEDNDSCREEKYSPVQETNPAPQALHCTQMTEQQDEQGPHTEPAEEDPQT